MSQLQEAYSWHLIAKENHKTILRLLDKDPSLFPEGTTYTGYPAYQDLSIISFVSIFERIILDNLLTVASNCKAREQDAFSRATVEYALRDPERWHFNDILDLYKAFVPADLVGEIKQIYQYRNWVAHGKKPPKPYSIDPKSAYQRLMKFLNEANIAL
jgi:hypothetical protein